MSIYALKPKFQALLRPLTAALARSGVTANQVTLAAAVVSIALGVFIAYRAPERWPFLLLPLWMFLRMALERDRRHARARVRSEKPARRVPQ